jgi:hypothetical protein
MNARNKDSARRDEGDKERLRLARRTQNVEPDREPTTRSTFWGYTTQNVERPCRARSKLDVVGARTRPNPLPQCRSTKPLRMQGYRGWARPGFEPAIPRV